MTTRDDAINAVRSLNLKVAALNCAQTINSAKYRHEIDPGYGKLSTATDVIAPLAAMVMWLRNEATMVNIPEGSYAWAVKLCEQAEMLVGQIGCIEMRIA